MAQIVLDAEAFKALSSDTRLQILKALDARRLTVSELGRLLELNKATVHEHLQQLAKADLVKKEDEGRKWVYYRLTWKGKNVLHPENVQFMLLLATSLLSVGGLVAQLGALLDWWGASPIVSELDSGGDGAPRTDGPQEESLRADSSAEGTQSAPADAGAPERSVDPFLTGDGPAGPEISPSGPWWNEPNAWLLGALLVLLVAVGVFAWRYVAEQRRERAPMLARIKSLPPPGPEDPATST